jgi:hypothetical protein
VVIHAKLPRIFDNKPRAHDPGMFVCGGDGKVDQCVNPWCMHEGYGSRSVYECLLPR